MLKDCEKGEEHVPAANDIESVAGGGGPMRTPQVEIVNLSINIWWVEAGENFLTIGWSTL